MRDPTVFAAVRVPAVVCPITSNTRPWPWKVVLPEGLSVSGAVLVDQVRAIDRTARRLRPPGWRRSRSSPRSRPSSPRYTEDPAVIAIAAPALGLVAWILVVDATQES